MVESEAEKILSKITIPTYIRIRCRETIVIVRIKSNLNFMFVTGSVNMKAWAITRKSRIGKFDQDHIKRRNNGNSVKKRLHGIQQTVNKRSLSNSALFLYLSQIEEVSSLLNLISFLPLAGLFLNFFLVMKDWGARCEIR